MKVSKVVAIVVALHVLVIGGIFVFEGCSRAKTPASQLADNETQPGDKTTPVAAPVADTNLTSAVAPAPPLSLAPVVPTPALTPVAASKTYVVKKGDTLYKIAKAEKTTIEQLAKTNNLTKTSMLKAGQKLIIPAAMTVAKTDKLAPVSGTDVSTLAAAGNAYEVKNGDSLWKIAKDNHTTVAALKQANNLTKDNLKLGQKLVIPVKATTTPAATPATATTTTAPATTPATSTPAVIAPALGN